MKKVIIAIVVLLIGFTSFLGWKFYFGDPEITMVESVKELLPFGSGDNLPGAVTKGENEEPGKITWEDTPKEFTSTESSLVKISDLPVAGFTVITKNGTAVVRYADRATGHIYDTSLPNATSSNFEKVKITNNTLPKIHEAHFRPDGTSVVYRSLEDNTDVIRNLSLVLTPPQATSSLHRVSSTALRGDMDSVVSGTTNLFYVLKDMGTIVSASFNGTGVKTLLTSAFDSWILKIFGNNLLIYTKPSSLAPGYAYSLNVSSGALSKLIGPLNGLMAVPNGVGNRVVYSYLESGVAKTNVRNLTDNSSGNILPVTLAEKCAWSTAKNYFLLCAAPSAGVGNNEPDNWSKGITHFSDRIWLFNTDTEIAKLLLDPKTTFNLDIDIYNPKLSPKEEYLVFINRTDLSLWALKLEAF